MCTNLSDKMAHVNSADPFYLKLCKAKLQWLDYPKIWKNRMLSAAVGFGALEVQSNQLNLSAIQVKT